MWCVLELCWIRSSQIRPIRHKLKMVRSSLSDETARTIFLCSKCNVFLHQGYLPAHHKDTDEKHLLDWKYTWPAFLWNLLGGTQAADNVPFYRVYEPSYLWRFIPVSLRPYWVDAIRDVENGAYAGCTLDHPPSFFKDRTADINAFNDDITEYKLPNLLHALKYDDERKSIMLPDVLCPWGCTEFCFCAQPLNLGLFIQHLLRKVALNLPQREMFDQIHCIESSRDDYI